MIPSMFHGNVDPLSRFTFEKWDWVTGDYLDKVVIWNGNRNISSVEEMSAIRLKLFQSKLFAYQV